jgi:signal transduction histidine kinase
LYQEIANVLPNSWRYSETAYARVVINNSEFRTENFKESPWKQISPVRFNGSVIGKIEVGYLEKRPEEDEGPFLRDERQLLEAIAERIGHITGRRWVEEELHRSNAKLGILNNITRHDINNQMMVINGFLELCRKREKDPDLAHYIDKMSLAAANVHEQINFTKDYQELGIKAPAWSSVGRRVKDAFAMLHPQGVVLEDRTEGIEVLTDPLADKVHYNLIDNSMRHGGKITRIKVYSEQSGDAMKIIYEDDGVGISQEDKKRLFQKGFGKNTGYGLFLIREILAITGITINETGHPGRGVRFEMLVPPGAWRRAPG